MVSAILPLPSRWIEVCKMTQVAAESFPNLGPEKNRLDQVAINEKEEAKQLEREWHSGTC